MEENQTDLILISTSPIFKKSLAISKTRKPEQKMQQMQLAPITPAETRDQDVCIDLSCKYSTVTKNIC